MDNFKMITPKNKITVNYTYTVYNGYLDIIQDLLDKKTLYDKQQNHTNYNLDTLELNILQWCREKQRISMGMN